MFIRPSTSFLPEERIQGAVENIGKELEERLKEMKEQGKLLEAQRLAARTRYDMEMLMEVGYCSGIENYSRHLAGRKPGETPTTLLDFFPPDSLLIMDESHVTVPQIRGMFAGDFSRKSTLVDHGFRLPSALDNRPLRFDEWEKKFDRRLFVSATPSDYEIAMSGGEVVEQVIRPTGLIDPLVRVEPARGQVPALLEEIKARAARGERVLVTTLDQEAGRGPVALFEGTGAAVQVAALGAGRVRAGHDPPRAARRSLRCTGRGQPAARGARPARGLDGVHPRRGQGRVSPERDVADPDDRPVGPACQRRGRALRRQDHRVDAAGNGRDESPPGSGNSSTMPSTASRPRRSSRRSAAGSKRKSRRRRLPGGPSAATRRRMPPRSI